MYAPCVPETSSFYEPRDPTHSILYHLVRITSRRFARGWPRCGTGKACPGNVCGTCSRGITTCVARLWGVRASRTRFLRARARHNGVADGPSGPAVIVQRFGGALNLNVHVLALVIDGVFVNDGERLRFQTAGRLRQDDVAEVVAVVAHRIDRLLQRRGVMATSEESGGVDRCAEEAPALAGLAAASVQGLLALGPRAGARIARYGSPPQHLFRRLQAARALLYRPRSISALANDPQDEGSRGRSRVIAMARSRRVAG